MSFFEYSRSPWTRRMLSVLRIVTGLVFITEGTTKLFGFPPSPTPLPPISLTSQLGFAGLLEVVGGICIVLGLCTRAVAFVLAGEMASAYFQAHLPKSFFPTTSGGVPALLFCFIYLYFVFAGAGPWSVDAMIGRSTRRKPPQTLELHQPERIRRAG